MCPDQYHSHCGGENMGKMWMSISISKGETGSRSDQWTDLPVNSTSFACQQWKSLTKWNLIYILISGLYDTVENFIPTSFMLKLFCSQRHSVKVILLPVVFFFLFPTDTCLTTRRTVCRPAEAQWDPSLPGLDCSSSTTAASWTPQETKVFSDLKNKSPE